MSQLLSSVIPVKYNLRSLMVRRMTSAMTALGVALVVMILFILLAIPLKKWERAKGLIEDRNSRG